MWWCQQYSKWHHTMTLCHGNISKCEQLLMWHVSRHTHAKKRPISLKIPRMSHIYVAYGLHFSYFSFRCVQWCAAIRSHVMLMQDHNVSSVVMSCSHIVTLQHDIIYDVIWHVLRAYNRPGTASWGDSWFTSQWVRRYTCMHRLTHWCAHVERA